METKLATAVTESTLIGSWGDYPRTRGNCFSVRTADGGHYKIVNFVHENWEEMLKRGITLPVKILPISERHAVIHDERIPDNWYQDRWCEVCCPKSLLPRPQLLAHDRHISSSQREEHGDGMVSIKMGGGPKL